jgi:TetR/AcrR family transcriptional regulator, transcriptional repressor for nem operon
MGHSRAEKAETHKRIVGIASKRFRENGLAGIGVADVMKEAGLTVGGFYKHFESRDDLVAEALGTAFGRSKPESTYAKLVNDYLSEWHRDDPGAGCAIGALAGEIARSDERTRALATEKIRNDIHMIATAIRDRDKGAARSKGILTYSALVGAIALARAVSDEKLSREILKTVAKELKVLAADGER